MPRTNLTKSLGKFEETLAFEVKGDTEVLQALGKLQRSISDRKTRRKVMRRAARIVVLAARQNIPISDRTPPANYRYSTPKIGKRIRAPKGRGVKVATYYPGNLRASIQRLNFPKSVGEYIGPKFVKRSKTGAIYGRSKYDGYYAAMLDGSANAFRRKRMEPALRQNEGKVYEQAVKDFDRILGKEKRKVRLG